MSEIELALSVSLKMAGLLEKFLQRAQGSGMSLLGYLEYCANVPAEKLDPLSEQETIPETVRITGDAVSEFMTAPQEVRTALMREAYNLSRMDAMSGEELRDLCRD